MEFEWKEVLIGIAFIIFGILLIVFPDLLPILVGIAFIVMGLLELIPRVGKKK